MNIYTHLYLLLPVSKSALKMTCYSGISNLTEFHQPVTSPSFVFFSERFLRTRWKISDRHLSCPLAELCKIKRKTLHYYLLLESIGIVLLECFLQLENLIRPGKWVSFQRGILTSFLLHVSVSRAFYCTSCNICICFATRQVVMRESAPTNLHFQL